jgi:4-hydroxybenzoate polyprenyltransferase
MDDHRSKRLDMPILTRIGIYLREMHPPQHLVFGLLIYISAYSGIAMLSANPIANFIIFKEPLLAGALTVMLFPLLLRIMDELKDLETDVNYFPRRPVPRGDVHPSDVKVLGLCVTGCLFLLNLFFTHMTIMFLAVFSYACLMFKYFFLRRVISNNLLLAFATHNPISYLLFLYIAWLYRENAAHHMDVPRVLVLGLVYFFASMAWEIARKIRYPEQETSYQTYSKLLGIQAALLIPILLSLLSLAMLCYLFGRIFSVFSFLPPLIAFALQTATFYRFCMRQRILLSPRSSTELFILTVCSILLLEGLRRC